jgi:endonuclease YncB( thermonuclease family)
MTHPPRLDVLAVAVTSAGVPVAGQVHAWTDGDTFDALVYDIIIDRPVVVRVRIMLDPHGSVNAPDRAQAGYAEVKAAAAEWLPPRSLVVLTIYRADKYSGRVDAAVATAGGESVAGWLLDRGFAVRWDGTGPRPTVPWPPTREDNRP